MTDATKHAVGLSVGTTTLAAVTWDNALRRPPALTLRGVTITDFVDRVGDPVGIVAPDGSSHRAEQVLAAALRDLAYEATRGAPLPELVAITVPAHWRPAAVEALTRALSRLPEWTRRRPVVLSEVAAAVTALQTDPGLPTRGVIAVCDFGGSGTSITLVDAANGCRPIGPTVRHLDFAGDMVDQALLTHVIGELAGAGSVDLNSTSAIGSLWRLRAQCRGAKERLSAAAVTAMPVELPEFRGDVRLTRTELDVLLREPLAGLLGVLQDTLRRNGIHPADLSAVASVGGGAGMAAVTTTLSEHLRVPVITTPRPALIPATGAALRVLRGPAVDAATALATAVRMAASGPVADPAPTFAPALAWSEAADEPAGPADDAPAVVGVTGARPRLDFEVDEHSASAAEPQVRWYRRPLALMAASIVVILAAIGAVGVVLTNDSSAAPASTPTPSISSTPEAPDPVVAQPPPAEIPAEAPAPQPAAPAPRTVYATPAPVTRTQVVQQQAPPVTVQAPAPAPADPPPAPETETVTATVTPSPQAPATEAPPAESTPPPASSTEHPRRWLPTIPPIPTIPGLPPLFPQPPQP